MQSIFFRCGVNIFRKSRLQYKFPFVLICSDKPGVHNFSVLKKLVLPDGSILRAKYAGRPTRDCLFNDPVMDGKRYILTHLLSLSRFFPANVFYEEY